MGNKAITLAEFLKECRDNKVVAIPKDDWVFTYAQDLGFAEGQDGMLAVAWYGFKQYYLYDETGRRPGKNNTQRDWRAHFRSAVRNQWAMVKCWHITESGECVWTSRGNQMRKEMQIMEKKNAQ